MIFENGDSVQRGFLEGLGFGIRDFWTFLVQRIRQQDFLRIWGIRWGEKLRNCPKSTYICFLFEFWTLVGWYSCALFDLTVRFCRRRCVAWGFDLSDYNANRYYSLCSCVDWEIRSHRMQYESSIVNCIKWGTIQSFATQIIGCPLCRVRDSIQMFVVRIVNYPLCRLEFDLIDCSTNRLLSAMQSGRFDLINWSMNWWYSVVRMGSIWRELKSQIIEWFVNSD